MQVGMIGLGRMGANMVRRLMRTGHDCVVFDLSPDAVAGLVGEGSTGSGSLEEFVAALAPPRCICIMVPAAFVDDTIARLAPLLQADDAIIDGGNSYYRDDLRRAAALGEQGLHYVDMGTSGGVFGLERGFCLMIGGDDEAVARLDPFFSALAPGVDAAPRTPGREGDPPPAEQGYLHCGPAGAGHFVKMVHNGIEYGMMGAYAEGLNILERANIGAERQEHDAETTPLRDPEAYRYDLPIAEIAEVWRRGSVVAGPHRAGTGPGPAARGLLRPRVGLRRGALDRARRHRRRRARPGDHRQPLRALRFARRGRVRQPRPLGDALRLRRAPGEEHHVVSPQGIRGEIASRP
jgi:6-phosphogluconate dehydrogenase